MTRPFLDVIFWTGHTGADRVRLGGPPLAPQTLVDATEGILEFGTSASLVRTPAETSCPEQLAHHTLPSPSSSFWLEAGFVSSWEFGSMDSACFLPLESSISLEYFKWA